MRRAVLLAALALGACAEGATPATCTAPLGRALAVDLYFGRDRPGGSEVSEAQWGAFLNDVVTPRFPSGLTVVDAGGQFRMPSGSIARERSKLLMIVVFDAPAHRAKVGEIVETYKQRFDQNSVLQTERTICAGL